MPLDLKLLLDIVIQLNITRKHASIYPVGHPQYTASLGRLLDVLNQYFRYENEIRLGVTGDSLLAGNEELGKGHPIVREFSRILHGLSIISLRIKAGVTLEELSLFNRLLSQDPGGGRGIASLQQTISDLGFEGIEIGLLNMEQMDFLEVEEIKVGEAPPAGEGESGSSWEKYVHDLLEGGSAQHLTAEGGISLTNVNPQKLAEFLNKLERKTPQQKLSYDKVIANYLRESEESQLGLAKVKDTHVKENFLSLVNNLNPQLRTEFLAQTIMQAEQSPQSSLAILQEAPGPLVLEALHQLNLAHKEVPPQVFRLVEALGGLEQSKPVGGPRNISEETEARIKEGLERLFGVSAPSPGLPQVNYMEMLREAGANLSRFTAAFTDVGGDAQAIPEPSPADNRDAFLEVNLDLLEQVSEDEILSYLHNIQAVLKELLQEKKWPRFLAAWNDITGLINNETADKVYLLEVIGDLKQGLCTRENILTILDALRPLSPEESQPLRDWISSLGNNAAEMLIEALSIEQDRALRRYLLAEISGLKNAALPHVLARLNDERWYVARNMLTLLQILGGVPEAARITPLTKHAHPKVRLEAIRTLLKLGFGEGVEILKKGILNADRNLSLTCIALAGAHRVVGLTDLLLSVVMEKRLMSVDMDYDRKRAAVRALGQIGNPAVLPELNRVLQGHKIFKQEGLNHLKMEIIRTIPQYPPDKAKELLRTGLQSGDQEIVNLCRSLARKISPRNSA